MKSRLLLILFSICCVSLAGLLFLKEEESLKVITSENIYSYKQSNLVETVPLHILLNKNDGYFSNIDYVESIELLDDGDIIPLLVKDIIQASQGVEYNDSTYYQTTYMVQVGFNSDDYLLSMDDCSLHIRYTNEEEFTVDIGSFYYLFDTISNDDISLGTYKATVKDINKKKTITGLHIELYNASRSNITIKSIELFSRDIVFNNQYSVLHDEDIDMFEEVERIVGDDFDSSKAGTINKEHLLRMKNYTRIYIPISFLSETAFIHRTMIQINYEKDGNMYQESIDDFPFISTSIFSEEYETGFKYYEYPNQ